MRRDLLMGSDVVGLAFEVGEEGDCRAGAVDAVKLGNEGVEVEGVPLGAVEEHDFLVWIGAEVGVETVRVVEGNEVELFGEVL